ncbi:MAG: winged helix-turn-helix domain-containing protein [Anaerolineae bacterium]
MNGILRMAVVRGQAVRLTPIEYRLLHSLIAEDGRTVSGEQLLDQVWGKGYDGCDDYLWVHISRLRRKLDTPGCPSLIVTERGVGYRVRKLDG